MYWRPPLRRPRLVCAIITCVFLLFYRRHIHAAILLAAEPLVFIYGDHSFIVSDERDNFDITFSQYSSSPITDTSLLNSNEYLVPPIIHSIFLGPNKLRSNWLAAHEACRDQHPSYEFMLWKDDNSERFVKSHYPEVYKTWISYPQLIQRADSLRYMLLHHYGGIYMDLDLHCRRPLDPLRQFPFVAPAAYPAGVSNGFIMSEPNSTFMENVIAALPWFDLNWLGLPYLRVSFSTGCHFLSTIHAWSPSSMRKDLRVLGGGPGGERLHQLNGNVSTPLFYHWGSSSWHKGDAEFFKMVKSGSWRHRLDQRVGKFCGSVIAVAIACTISVVCLVSMYAVVRAVRIIKCHCEAESDKPRGRRMRSPAWKGELKV